METLQSTIFIEFDVNTKKITFLRKDNIIDYDSNATSVYVRVKYKDLSGNTTYLTPSELEDYEFTLYTIKPATNKINEITGEVTDELKENAYGGVVKFEIPKACTNRLGIVKCEIHINQWDKMIASSTFVLDVKQSLVTAFDDELLGDEDFPVLKQLILEIQKDSNIDDNNRSKMTSYSSDKIETIKKDLSSQIKEKANKDDAILKGYGTLNDFDESTRAVLQGLNPGQINAVLGEKNVTLENLSFSKILSKNLLNKNTIILNKEFSSDGSIIDSSDKFISDFIPCKPDTIYSQYQIENNSNVDNRQYAVFYDSNKNIVKVTDYEPWSVYTTPSNCSFIRTSNFLIYKETSMLTEGRFNPNEINASYEEYKIAISSDDIDLSNIYSKIDTLEEQAKQSDNYELPEYWTTYLDDRINTIKNELCKPETFYAPIIFVTDSHYATSNNVDAKIINYLDENLPIAQVLHGGDFITIESTYLDCFNNLNICVDKYKNVKEKFLPALGNHDCVSSGTSPTPFRKSQADEIIFKNLNEVVNVCKPNNTAYVGRIYDILGNFGYYYKDDEIKKIRYIILNSCDNFRDNEFNDISFAFKDQQVEWLASEALNFENKGKGWRIVVLSHLYTENSNINGSEGEGTTYNIEHVKGILNAYINKTIYTFNNNNYDFSQNDNKIVGYFCGHYHYPSLFKDGDLNVCVGLNADGHVYTPANCNEIQRTKGTINETALEVLLIGTNNCKLFRIGAGEDRSFTF